MLVLFILYVPFMTITSLDGTVLVRRINRYFDEECGSLTRRGFCPNLTTMCLNYLLANVKSQACAGDAFLVADAIETIKNKGQCFLGNARTTVHKGNDYFFTHLFEQHNDRRIGRIFNGVGK